MNGAFRGYAQGGAGFTMPVPVDWEVTEDIEWCTLVAVENRAESGRLAANVVVTLERLEEETLNGWVKRSRDALYSDEGLNRLAILDTEETEVSGLPAHRTFSHYLHRTAGGVNLEQWAVGKDGWGYVVSCSTSALDYDDYADVMAYMAEGLRIEGEPTVDGVAEGQPW